VQELFTDADPTFRAVFRLYESTFSEGEKESLAAVRAVLAEDPRARGGDRYHVIAARDARGRVVGGAFFHYVASLNAGFLGYVFVHRARRRQGIGRRLLGKVSAILRRDARLLRRSAPSGLFFELKKGGDPKARGELRFWSSLGVVLLDLDWQYPRLRPGAAPLDMWLAFRPRRRSPVRITRPFLRRAVTGIYASVYGRTNPRADTSIRQILRSIRGAVAPWPE
jgi:GNAT superfamily N-acetyltransferase